MMMMMIVVEIFQDDIAKIIPDNESYLTTPDIGVGDVDVSQNRSLLDFILSKFNLFYIVTI